MKSAHLSTPDEATRGTRRRGIQSVEVGMRVIEAVRAGSGPRSLKEVASGADLSPSNCHRYLVSFVRTGFVTQDVHSGRYDLGPRLLQAGLAALSRIDAVTLATEGLEKLVDATGNTGLLAVWADHGPSIVRWMPGRMAVHTSITTGSTLPLLTSATGRVFLAYLPARQTATLVAREMKSSGCNADVLAEQVRTSGFGEVSGNHIPGLSAIAAPILDVHCEAAAVLTLVCAEQGIAPAAIERLRLEAAAVSARLGWTHRTAEVAAT